MHPSLVLCRQLYAGNHYYARMIYTCYPSWIEMSVLFPICTFPWVIAGDVLEFNVIGHRNEFVLCAPIFFIWRCIVFSLIRSDIAFRCCEMMNFGLLWFFSKSRLFLSPILYQVIEKKKKSRKIWMDKKINMPCVAYLY